MTHVVPPDDLKSVYVSDTGNDGNDGKMDVRPKRTLADVKTTADALLPVLGDPVAIIDQTASTYPENLVISDNVFVDMPLCRMVGATGTIITAGANTVANFLTVQTSLTAGDIAWTSGGKSRLGFNAPSVIITGSNQTGLLINGTSAETFPNVSQILSLGDNNILHDHTSSGDSHNFNGNSIEFAGNNSTAFRVNTTSTDVVTYRVGSINQTGTGNVAIETVNGNAALYANDIGCDIIVGAGSTLSLNDAVMNGDIFVDAGATLNLSILSHPTGTITGTGTVVGSIGNEIVGTHEVLGDLNVSGATNAASITSTGTVAAIKIKPLSDTAFGPIFEAPASMVANYDITLPVANGVEGQQWQLDSSLELQWVTPANFDLSFPSTETGLKTIHTVNNVTVSWDADNWLIKVTAGTLAASAQLSWVVNVFGENGETIVVPEDDIKDLNGEFVLASDSVVWLTTTGLVDALIDLQDRNQRMSIGLNFYLDGIPSTSTHLLIDIFSRGNNLAGGVDINAIAGISELLASTPLLYYLRFDPKYLSGIVLSSPYADFSSGDLQSSATVGHPDNTGGSNALKLNAASSDFVLLGDTANQIGGDTSFDMYVRWDSFALSGNFARVFEFANTSDADDNILLSREATTSDFNYQLNIDAALETAIVMSGFWVEGEWVRVTITVDGTTGETKVYRDGIFIDLASPPPGITVITNTQGLAIPTKARTNGYIGQSNFAGDGYPDISINNFRVYNEIIVPE